MPRTADRPDIAARFPTDDIFYAIRLEPYLVATARAHPDLAPRLAGAGRDDAHDQARARPRRLQPEEHPDRARAGPVILDAECAWYGDPAFDLAFVLNHLLLKGAWRPAWRARYVDAFAALVEAYLRPRRVGAAGGARGAHRGAAAGLMLARIDGKSPVEYLTRGRRPGRGARVRPRAAASSPVRELGAIAARWVAAGLERRDDRRRSRRFTRRRVWDSRGRPTVEAEVTLAGGARGRAIAPAGASRGSREAIDLRDGGERFGGIDVTAAIANVDGPIARALAGPTRRTRRASTRR